MSILPKQRVEIIESYPRISMSESNADDVPLLAYYSQPYPI